MKDITAHIILFVALSYGSISIAGGPTTIAGADGQTPVTYQNPAVTVNVENGDLGILSNAVAVTLMQQAFDLWGDVSTANVILDIDQLLLDFEIDQNNAETYLPTIDQADLNADDNVNPVVFDSDGQIIDDYFGNGQSDFIIGFAQSIHDIGGSYFLEGFVVINGKNSTTDTAFKQLLAHEIGHFIGLDHTQVNIDNRESFLGTPDFCSSTVRSNYPLMYPIRCRDTATLHADDISAVSALYPATDIDASLGILQGVFVDETGNAILGANIWVEDMTTGKTYSIISDYLTQDTGFYRLRLPAGNYTLHANSLNTEFVDVSNVGPYASTPNDRSFTSPHPITAVTYQGTTVGSDEAITISANNTVTINFSITGNDAVINSNQAEDGDDSIADLFGSMSHMTLLAMAVLLMLARIRSKH